MCHIFLDVSDHGVKFWLRSTLSLVLIQNQHEILLANRSLYCKLKVKIIFLNNEIKLREQQFSNQNITLKCFIWFFSFCLEFSLKFQNKKQNSKLKDSWVARSKIYDSDDCQFPGVRLWIQIVCWRHTCSRVLIAFLCKFKYISCRAFLFQNLCFKTFQYQLELSPNQTIENIWARQSVKFHAKNEITRNNQLSSVRSTHISFSNHLWDHKVMIVSN